MQIFLHAPSRSAIVVIPFNFPQTAHTSEPTPHFKPNALERRAFRCYPRHGLTFIRKTILPEGEKMPRCFRHVRAFAPAILVATLAFIPRVANATEQIDQQFLASTSPVAQTYAISNNQSWGQTFTVGMNGYLTRIDLQMTHNAGTFLPLNIEIRKSGAQPDLSPTGLLYSASVPVSSVNGPLNSFTTTIDLLAGNGSFPVAVGDKLAILGSTGGDWYNWGSVTADTYAGGTALHRFTTSSGNFTVRSNDDSGFRTWVSEVPEPSALLLSLIALPTLLNRRKH
jgi:hypothetical protein